MILPGFPRTSAGQSAPYVPIPDMTSNTTPAGWTAFASSEEDAARQAWKAFDGIENAGWWAPIGAAPWFVGLTAPNQLKVMRYGIVCANVTTVAPGSFRLEGSNDGSSWTTLDSRSGITWSSTYQRQEWDVSSAGLYSRHRLYVTAASSGATLRVCELVLLQKGDL